MSETPERAFTIDGADYPIPQLTSLTLDEAVVFFRNTGYPVEDLWVKPKDVRSRAEMLDRLRDPAVVRTLVHLAYRRGNPGVADDIIAEVIGKVQLIDALSSMMLAGDNHVPLDVTPEPNGSSSRRTTGASKRSGRGSGKSSAAPAARRAPTGT